MSVYNLHNHTPFSDGAYSIDEICEAHLALAPFQCAGIGISDHLFATPSSRPITGERDFDRLFSEETRRYVEQVHEARGRWSGRLEILCGAEVNWPMNKGMLESVRRSLEGVDYVLFEFVDWAGLTQLANQARKFPCPVGLAHTQVGSSYPNTSFDQVVRTLANARIFYEVSSKFLPLSERDPWYRLLPNHRVSISVGTDTHDDLNVIRTLPTLADFVQARGLGDRLLQLTPASVSPTAG